MTSRRGPFPLAALRHTGTVLDEASLADVREMWHNVPVIAVARRLFLSMVLSGSFSFAIPKLGLRSNTAMDKMIQAYWLPWLRQVYEWIKLVGVCPYFLIRRGEHRVPVTPDWALGYISVETVAREPARRFHWNWYAPDKTNPTMYWVLSEDAPSPYGVLRSALSTLLAQYRSLRILERAQDVAATQCARRVHVLERRPDQSLPNDGLNRFSAYKNAETHQRHNEVADMQLRLRTRQIAQALNAQGRLRDARSTATPLSWTESEAEALEEIDDGLARRVVVLNPGLAYKEPAKPSLVAKVEEARRQFDIMAAAAMDMALEMIMPLSAARAQSQQGVDRFQTERVREQVAFFSTALKNALILAYRDAFEETFGLAWRAQRTHDAVMLYPELDVVVELVPAALATDAEITDLFAKGLISQATMGHLLFRSKNLPEALMTLRPPVELAPAKKK
jgi:hypothetical protein